MARERSEKPWPGTLNFRRALELKTRNQILELTGTVLASKPHKATAPPVEV